MSCELFRKKNSNRLLIIEKKIKLFINKKKKSREKTYLRTNCQSIKSEKKKSKFISK